MLVRVNLAQRQIQAENDQISTKCNYNSNLLHCLVLFMENDPPPPDSEIKQQIKVKIVKAPAIREISKEEVTRGLQSGAFRKGKEKDKVKLNYGSWLEIQKEKMTRNQTKQFMRNQNSSVTGMTPNMNMGMSYGMWYWIKIEERN